MRRSIIFSLLLGTAVFGQQAALDIVRKSVAANDADWKLIPRYSHSETDVEARLASDGHVRSKTVKTYEQLMIDGSPYEKMTAINGRPLSAEQVKAENEKLEQEIAVREHETPSQRAKRIAKYQRERAQDHMLMHEMINAFNFKLVGEQNVNGHDCYVLEATPKPGYTPPSQEAKVLTGMEGKLWVDKAGYHWVKVEAHVTKPVSTYLVANVRPGTKFVYEQSPVNGVWLPRHFSQSVNARVLGIHSIVTSDDEQYANYRPAEPAQAYLKSAEQAHR